MGPSLTNGFVSRSDFEHSVSTAPVGPLWPSFQSRNVTLSERESVSLRDRGLELD